MKKRFYTLFALAFALLFATTAMNAGNSSDPVKDEIRSKLPQTLGNTNAGTEFYLSFPPCYEESGASNSLYLYVSAGVKTRVTVKVEGKGIVYVKETIPNDVVAFQIAPGVGQAYTKGPMTPPPTDKVYSQMGLHIYAEDPIIVYGATRFAYTSDTFLGIPVSALGKEYIVASMADMSAMYPGYYLVSETTVTAAYDNTTVNFTLGGNTVTQTAGGMKPGDFRQYKLAKKGDVLVISSKGNEADLSGSKIVADKPVAVISGNQCSNVPTESPWCDFIAEMELPTNTWGTAYHVTKIKNRLKCSYVKIFAKEDNTTIYRNGQSIGLIKKAGGVLDVGYIYRRVADGPAKSYVISGDKPISVTQFNTGQSDDNITSDPFQLVLTPLEQFQKEITFNTPGLNGGFGFMRNHVSLVYELNQTTGQIPDDLEFATVKDGQFQWVKVKTKFGSFIGEEFGTKVNNKRYACKLIDLPGDGVYKIRANTPFAAYAYGFSDYDSYGHPTAVALGDLTKPDTVAPIPTWTIGCDGNVKDGVVNDMPDDDSVRSNLANVYMDKAQSNNYQFSYVKFVAGEDRKTTWNLSVVDPLQDAKAVLIFLDRAGNDTSVVITYLAPKMAITPNFVDFGKLKKGEIKDLAITVTNASSTSDVVVTRLEFKNKNQNFAFEPALSLPMTLKPLEGKNLTVRFTAAAEGEFKDSIGIGNECVFGYKTEVKAQVGVPVITVTDFDYGQIVVGDNSDHDFEIRNLGTVTLTVNKVANGPAFTVFTPTYAPLTFPFTIEPGKSENFKVKFAPTAEQSYSDQILFDSDSDVLSPNHDAKCMLLGQGIKPGLATAGYDWNRKRINKTYGGFSIPLNNSGSAKVTVTDVTFSGDVSKFYVNGAPIDQARTSFLGDIPGGNTANKTFVVEYRPTTRTNDQVSLTFKNSTGEDRVAVLKGTGIAPTVVAIDFPFDTLSIGQTTGMKPLAKIFTCETGPFADSLTITSLKFVNTPEGDFAYDVADANAKIAKALQPGESITILASFTAKANGDRKATLSTVSDAMAEATSTWTGVGKSSIADASLTGGAISAICSDATNSVNSDFVNQSPDSSAGGKSLRIDEVLTDNPKFTATLVGASIGDILKPSESVVIKTVYTPSGAVGAASTKLTVKYTELAKDPKDNVANSRQSTITADAYHYSAKISLNNEATTKLLPGENFKVSASVDATLPKQAGVQTLSMTMTYDKDALRPRDVQGLNGVTVKSSTITTPGTLVVTLGVPASGILSAGKIMDMVFDVFLASSPKVQNQTLNPTLVAVTDCADITVLGTTYILGDYCGSVVRPINGSGVEYVLRQNEPNPVKNQTVINFAVGLKAPTTITLYNAMGEKVTTLVSGEFEAGEYEATINAADLPTGVYLYQIVSGPFTETKRMVITK